MHAEPQGPDKPDRRVSPRSADVVRRERIIQGVAVGIGLGIALVGAGLMAIAVVDLVTGGDDQTAPGASLGLIVVFGAMIWWGVQIGWPELAPRPLARRLLARRAARRVVASDRLQPPVPDDAERERVVLSLAEKEQGRLTALEVAARCDLTAEEAKALLDGFVLRKVAQLHVSEAGVLVYVFPRHLPGSGRARRRRR